MFSGLPGEHSSTADYYSIYKKLSKQKIIFLKVIPPIILFWILIYSIQLIVFLFLGANDCTGNTGPNIPTFFCDSKENIFFKSFVTLIVCILEFVIASEFLLVLFFLAGKYKNSKYNLLIPKPIMIILTMLFISLIFLGLTKLM